MMKRVTGVLASAAISLVATASAAIAQTSTYPVSPHPSTSVEGASGGSGGTAFTVGCCIQDRQPHRLIDAAKYSAEDAASTAPAATTAKDRIQIPSPIVRLLQRVKERAKNLLSRSGQAHTALQLRRKRSLERILQ